MGAKTIKNLEKQEKTPLQRNIYVLQSINDEATKNPIPNPFIIRTRTSF